MAKKSHIIEIDCNCTVVFKKALKELEENRIKSISEMRKEREEWIKDRASYISSMISSYQKDLVKMKQEIDTLKQQTPIFSSLYEWIKKKGYVRSFED